MVAQFNHRPQWGTDRTHALFRQPNSGARCCLALIWRPSAHLPGKYPWSLLILCRDMSAEGRGPTSRKTRAVRARQRQAMVRFCRSPNNSSPRWEKINVPFSPLSAIARTWRLAVCGVTVWCSPLGRGSLFGPWAGPDTARSLSSRWTPHGRRHLAAAIRTNDCRRAQ